MALNKAKKSHLSGIGSVRVFAEDGIAAYVFCHGNKKDQMREAGRLLRRKRCTKRVLRFLLTKQHSSCLLTPVANGTEICLPYTAIAATAATTDWLFRRIAKRKRSLGKLCAEVCHPLPGLLCIGW